MNNDLISREALKEDFKSRLALCNEWIAKAKDKETKIRASAVKAFIAEVIITIDKAPTVEPKQGKWIGKEEYDDYPNKMVCECSECGKMICVSHNDFPKFCENCGVQMKGGAE